MPDEYSPTDLQQLEMLGRLIAVSDREDPPVPVRAQDVTGAGDRPGRLEDARFQLDELGGRGWLVHSGRLALGWYITDSGRTAWHTLVRLRDDTAARRRQMRNEYLAWIYTRSEEWHGHSPVASDFLTSGASFHGMSYSRIDLDRVGAWLAENGFIQGSGSSNGDGPLRPDITTKGVRYVEDGIDVHTPPEVSHSGGVQYQVNLAGGSSANIAQGSHHVTQTVNVGWETDAIALADAIVQRLNAVPTSTANEELRAAAEELRAATESKAEPGKVRQIAGKIALALGTAAGAELGTDLMRHALTFLTSLA